MASLRSTEIEKEYKEYLETHPQSVSCGLCEKESLKGFRFWKISENSFPYDMIARVHHMLLPLRHVSEEGLTTEEIEEFKHIKNTAIHSEYDWIIEATNENKSVPNHFHVHLIVQK